MFGVLVFKIPFPLNTRGLTHLDSAKVTSGIFSPPVSGNVKDEHVSGKHHVAHSRTEHLRGEKANALQPPW